MKTKAKILTSLVLLVLLMGCASAISWYNGSIKVVSKNISAKIEYKQDNSIAYTRGVYVLKNTDKKTKFDYSISHLGETIDSGSLELKSGEVFYLDFAQEISLPSNAIRLDYGLKLNDEYIGKSGSDLYYSVDIPSNSTILSVRPEPDSKTGNLSWKREDAVPGALNPRINWIRESINLDLTAKADAHNLTKGQQFNVTYVVKNNDERTYDILLKDTMRAESFEPVDNESYELKFGEFQFWLMRENFTLDPGQEISLTQEVRFLGSTSSSLRPPGFSVSVVGSRYHKKSNRLSFSHPVCNHNGVCEPEENENKWNCPSDCQKGQNVTNTSQVTTSTISPTVTSTTSPQEDGGTPIILYVVGGLLVLLVIGILYSASQKSHRLEELEEEEKMEKWIEEQLRDGEDPKKLKSVVQSQGYDREMVDHVLEKL